MKPNIKYGKTIRQIRNLQEVRRAVQAASTIPEIIMQSKGE